MKSLHNIAPALPSSIAANPELQAVVAQAKIKPEDRLMGGTSNEDDMTQVATEEKANGKHANGTKETKEKASASPETETPEEKKPKTAADFGFQPLPEGVRANPIPEGMTLDLLWTEFARYGMIVKSQQESIARLQKCVAGQAAVLSDLQATG